MENTIRTFTMYAKEIRKETQVFIANSAEINKKWYKIKFTRDCIDVPKTKGMYEVTIDLDECFIEKGKTYTKANGEIGLAQDTIWIKHIVGIRKYTDDDLKGCNRMTMSAVFGE